MTDRYLKMANRPVGRWLVKTMGLPAPVPLKRYRADKPLIDGNLLIGGSPQSQLLTALATTVRSMDAQTLFHNTLPGWANVANSHGLITGRWANAGDTGVKVKGLVFDATGLSDSAQTDSLYQFFHDSARSLLPCARIVILGRPPERCSTPAQATVQRSLEGLTRSLGKEFKRGATSQLVYVEEGAESNIESTLRFLLSAKSAYVSSQVIRVGATVGDMTTPDDWSAPLTGKKALVTGASRGIGLSIAQTLARDGAELILLDIPPLKEDLEKVAKELDAKTITMDISDSNAAQQLVASAEEDGGWDVLVHNAGITRDKRIGNMKPEVWQQVVNINLSAQERINEAMLSANAINRNGRVVCVSSISGLAGNMGQTNYALSKAGVVGMVQSMAPVLAQRNITINAVAPGFIETKMTAKIPFAIREAGRRMNSLNQGGLPVDVAEAIAWFGHPASSGLNGNIVRVCGQSLIGA